MCISWSDYPELPSHGTLVLVGVTKGTPSGAPQFVSVSLFPLYGAPWWPLLLTM